MRLSEELKQLHDCGDVGSAVEGLSERAERLEKVIFNKFYYYKLKLGPGGHEEAVDYANRSLDDI